MGRRSSFPVGLLPSHQMIHSTSLLANASRSLLLSEQAVKQHNRTLVVTERIDLWSRACTNKNESNHVKLKEPGSCLSNIC